MERKQFDKLSTNICKGIAILLMYVHHCFASEVSWSDADVIWAPFSQSHTITFATLCKVCVGVFVFLSGFGVYRSAQKTKDRSLKESYLPTVTKRYSALLFSFSTVYILTQIFSGPLGVSRVEIYGESLLKRIQYTLIDGLGLAKAFGTPTYNKTWWYMSLAFLFILILPLLAKAAEVVGYALLPVCVLIPALAGFDMGSNLFRYLPAAILGILCAQYEVFERLREWMERSAVRYLTGTAITCFGMLVLAFCRKRLGFPFVYESLLGMVICFFGYIAVERIVGLNRCMAFLGKHSMNMFLIHTMIRGREMSLHKFSYAPRYTVLIVLLLTADTLLLSIAIEWLKKGLRAAAGKVIGVFCRT